MKNNPLSSEKISELFTLNKEKTKLIRRESATLEFKESFNFGSMAMYFRTIASFANRNGGYIIFGIKDRPREPIGLKEKSLDSFENLKIEEFTNNLNEYFSPEITWEHCTYEFDGKNFGIIYIHELENKPSICKKNYENKEDKYSLKDGDIYYRYAGRSQKIRHSELIEIIDNKRKKEEKMWLEYLIKSAKIGIENIGLLDLETGNIQGKKVNSIYIDEPLLKQIKFIQEGKFEEKEGTPTLKLMGEIEKINGEKIIVKEEKEKIKIRGISEIDIIETFLKDINVSEEVEEYIKGIPNCKSGFMPIYYYFSINNITIEEGIEIIENVNVRTKAKTKLLERIKQNRREKIKIPNINNEEILQMIDKIKNEEVILKEENINTFLKSVLCLENETVMEHIKYIKKLLLNIFEEKYASDNRDLVGKIRKSICRIDETQYGLT
ncbi:MAG: helix-turn-helix domain-containing protein [Clostridia bacterium]